MSELNVDTINEQTSANGVTIDGVKLKDNAVETDTISEKTSGSGVTIDSVLVKDGIAHSGIVKLAQATASSSNTDLTFDNFVDNSTYAYYKFTVEGVYTTHTSGDNFNAHWRTSGGADISDTYYNAYYERDLESGQSDSTGKSNDTVLNIWGGQSNTAGEAFYGEGSLWCPDNSYARFQLTASLKNSSDRYMWAERYSMTSSVTGVKGIRFFMNTGTVAAGTVTIFGVKK